MIKRGKKPSKQPFPEDLDREGILEG